MLIYSTVLRGPTSQVKKKKIKKVSAFKIWALSTRKLVSMVLDLSWKAARGCVETSSSPGWHWYIAWQEPSPSLSFTQGWLRSSPGMGASCPSADLAAGSQAAAFISMWHSQPLARGIRIIWNWSFSHSIRLFSNLPIKFSSNFAYYTRKIYFAQQSCARSASSALGIRMQILWDFSRLNPDLHWTWHFLCFIKAQKDMLIFL